MPLASAQVVCEPTLLGVCVRLLHVAQTKLCNLGGASDTASVPRWLAPLLLLLDLWEKTVLVAKWHRPKKPVSLGSHLFFAPSLIGTSHVHAGAPVMHTCVLVCIAYLVCNISSFNPVF